jgi:succinate dehydrogenase / fumarate reductase cytochrome b subunit
MATTHQSQSYFFKSTIAKKIMMALTGLFLILFLMGHLAGNLQLILADKTQFNEYAYFMTHNPLVKILSYTTYTCIILHVVDAIIITLSNRKARPVGYAVQAGGNVNSQWTSRNMGVLGTLVLVFLVIHMQQFWYVMHWGAVPYQTLATGETLKDLHAMVAEAFAQPLYVLLYVASMCAVGFHLWHGFASAFQTLGLGHKPYASTIQWIGRAFAVVVAGAFALIPLVMYFVK